mgnify:CR=1 FL=1
MIQGLRERWDEFVKLLERTGPQTRLRIELLTAADQDKVNFSENAKSFDQLLTSVSTAYHKPCDSLADFAALLSAQRQLRDAPPKFSTLVSMHGTLLVAETPLEESKTFTSTLEVRAALYCDCVSALLFIPGAHPHSSVVFE